MSYRCALRGEKICIENVGADGGCLAFLPPCKLFGV